MFYYIQRQGDEVVAWLQSATPHNRPGFVQVTPEEFLEQGGLGLEAPPSVENPQDPYAEMAKAIREGVNEV